jgi:hypothetical protein
VSEIAAVREAVHFAIQSLNELKEAESWPDQAVGLWWLPGSPDAIAFPEAGDIFAILDRACAIAQNSSF